MNTQSSPPLPSTSIPDTNFDGSVLSSTFWFSVVSPLFSLATLLAWSFAPASWLMTQILPGVLLLALAYSISVFPSEASTRFVTTTFKRPPHTMPSLLGGLSIVLLVCIPIFFDSFLPLLKLTTALHGTFLAFVVCLSITTHGRYALNYIAMTRQLMAIICSWGLSIVFQDYSVLYIVSFGLTFNLMWQIHRRWAPVLDNLDVIHRTTGPV